MSRTILVIGGVLVIGLAIAVWVMSRPSDDASASTASQDPVAPASEGDTPRPSLPAPGTGTSTRTRAHTGDAVVHDHRTGDSPPSPPSPPSPDVVEPNPNTKRDRELPSNLTFDVTRGVKHALEECASAIPAGERTQPSRLRGSIDLSIKDHVATIRTMDLSITGATGPAFETAKQCVVQKSQGLQTPAGDQQDLESYSIEVSFRLP